MSNVVKEKQPTNKWVAPQIPGLISKKKKDLKPIEIKAEVPMEGKGEPGLGAVKSVSDTAPNLSLTIEQAHNELVECLSFGSELIKRLECASQMYYMLCSVLDGFDPTLNEPNSASDGPAYFLSTLRNEHPETVKKLIEGEANKMVNHWRAIKEVSDRANELCDFIIRAAETSALDNKLEELTAAGE